MHYPRSKHNSKINCYKNIEKDVLMTVITRKEIGELNEIIEDIDPEAFVIITNVHEVLGEGFRRRI